MRDALNTWLEIQKSAFENAAHMTSAMMKMNARLMEQQMSLFRSLHDHRRMDETPPVAEKPDANPNPKVKRKRVRKRKGHIGTSPCCGPDLMDHYGKRAHDVDVERI